MPKFTSIKPEFEHQLSYIGEIPQIVKRCYCVVNRS